MTVLSQPQPLYFALQQLVFIHNLSRAWKIALIFCYLQIYGVLSY